MRNNKVTKYPNQFHFSIGIVIVGVIFIYMVYHFFTFITAKNTTIYEVSNGSISSNHEYNALAVRDETIYYAENSGNIIYLAENFGRIGVKTNIYAIDSSGKISASLDKQVLDTKKLDSNSFKKIQYEVTNFILDYNNEDFIKTYAFKSDLDAQIDQLYNSSAMNSMQDKIDSAINQGTFYLYKNQTPGLLVYSIDGMENISISSFTNDSLNATNLKVNNLKLNNKVKKGDPVYKIVNSDKWNLICEIDKHFYNSLKEDQYIQIEFLEDELKTWTSYELEEKQGKYYIILYLDDGMDRYADSRYIHIKLIDNNISGLKIPNSSIVEKEFFTIPKNYFYQGDNSSDLGLMVRGKNHKPEFVAPTIYYENKDYFFVDDEKLNKGDILIKSNSSENYVVGNETAKLKGVYNVNKGYAVFKQIEILYQNEEYSIIKTGTNYGISMYDHIVLQGDDVEENMIIN